MAFDDLLASYVGTVSGYLGRSLQRWRDAANAARLPAYTVFDLFATTREQFVDNWDTWNGVMAGPVNVPTITITAGGGGLNGRSGSAIVRQRLTGLAFQNTPLDQFGGANSIPPGGYVLAVLGDFDGRLQVTMAANAPAAGMYRGMVLGRAGAGAEWQPIAWVVAISP